MDQLDIKRLMLFLGGAVLVGIGIRFLYSIYDTGTGVFITSLPIILILIGVGVAIDSLQKRYELGKISSTMLVLASAPVICIGIYAILVSYLNPDETFAGLFLILGTVICLAGLLMILIANLKLDLCSKASNVLT